MSSSGAGGALEKNLYEQVIDAFNAIFGSHPGYRPLHAKGLVCEGTFHASDEARALTRAAHMQGSLVPLMVRFSDFSGDPGVHDSEPTASPRGMAIRFRLQGGTSTDIVAHSYNGFPARDVTEFLAFLRALGSSGSGVKKPTPLDAFLADHLSAKLFVEAPKPMPQSFATESYYAVDAFQFVDRDGRRQPGRYRVIPIAGERHLQSTKTEDLPSNYLFDELRQRLQNGPVEFRLMVQLAADGDPVKDPTRPWPEDRQQKELGILSITKPSAASSSIERSIGFDPARLIDGIEPGDPLIQVRSAVYAISTRHRGT